MIEHLEQFILKRNLCQKQNKILLAVSGGVDSVVLLDLFVKIGYTAGIAHCNFGLRGKESDGDEFFVKDLAKKNHIPIFIKRFETEHYATQNGISIQMAARDLRYTWFEELIKAEGYDLIATAHNFNDTVETVLFNLIKGSGLKGLTGIPVRTRNIIRPMLFATRKEIDSYAATHQLPFREDSSNTSIKYHRNHIRHKIIPELEKINPGFIDTMKNTLARLDGMQRVCVSWLESHESDILKQKGGDMYLNKDFFMQVREPAVLYEVIHEFGFNFDQCTRILEFLDGGSGKVYYSDKYVLNNDRTHLIISRKGLQKAHIKISSGEKMIETDRFKLEMDYMERGIEKMDENPDIAYLDHDSLKYPLEFRNWEEGDWFVPLGMKGKKKLSDFMIDKKIPLNLKNRIMVLVSGGTIAWVAGFRLDDRFKVKDDTKNILKITYQKLDD
jgi:tRNA(Ile)-lysidine synthase